jgi:predicted  nucleic acid-binding Zn-ribbon protein
MTIKIFPQELLDGLEASISNNTIAFLSQPIEKTLTGEALTKAIALANPNQIDLFYIESILASVGMNLNDDVFDPMELFAARNSAVDKPFNFMHNESDIIGHITSSRVVDPEGNLLTEANDQSKFDVVVGSVIYRKWEDKDRQERINSFIEGIANGEWFVSMECIFPNFDYFAIDEKGVASVIKRDEKTSFLTKYLRIYKGPGSYQGYKLGRLLRNLTFSGKGLVNKPANERSKILTFNNRHEVSVYNTVAAIKEAKEIFMPDTVTYTEEQYKSLLTQNHQAVASLKDATSNLGLAQKDVELLQKTEASLRGEIEVLKASSSAKDEQITNLKSELAKSVAECSDKEAEMKKMKDEKTKSERLNKLMARKIDEAKAKEMVDKFLSVADELFDELVSAYPEKEAVAEEVVAPVAPVTDPVEAQAALDAAKAAEDLNLGVQADNVQELEKTLATWLTQFVPAKKQ